MSQPLMYPSHSMSLSNRVRSDLVTRLNIDLVKGHPARIEKLNQLLAEAAADGEGAEYIHHFTQKRDNYQAEWDSYREAGLV